MVAKVSKGRSVVPGDSTEDLDVVGSDRFFVFLQGFKCSTGLVLAGGLIQ